MRKFDTLEQIADYVDTCVCENFDININPDKFDTLAELVSTYCDDIREGEWLTLGEFQELIQLCDTPSIKRLVK